MAMYLGEDKVASLGSICNVSGSASKNLFNKDIMVEFKNGYRLYTDGTFNNNSSFYGLKIPVQPNTTYTSSSNLTDTNLWSDLCFFDKGMNFINGVEGRTNKTFTTPTNCYFVTYAIYNQYQWFQLEKGSNATEYEKYYEPIISIRDSKGDYHEVPYATGKASKNLFDGVIENGGYNYNDGSKTTNNDHRRNSNFIPVEPSTTYIFSNNGVGVGMNIMFYDKNGNYLYYETMNAGIPFTTSSKSYYVNFFRGSSSCDAIQLEKGSTITSYEEYYEPTVSIRNSNGVFQEVEINKTNYSLAEQRIGTWMGKPLYRKVVTYSTKITSGTVQIPHNISNLDLVTKCDYMVKWDGKNYPAPIIYSEYSKQVIVNYIGASYIYVKSFGETWDAYTLTITLEYTKN